MTGNSANACEQCPGKPVDLVKGTVSTDILTDIVLDDPLLPLKVQRRWSTELAEHHWYSRDAFMPLGKGWATTFDQYLEIVPHQPVLADGQPKNDDRFNATDVLWVTPDGGQYTFQYSPSSETYSSPVGRTESLQRTRPEGGNPPQYRLQLADGSLVYFERPNVRSHIAHLRTILMQSQQPGSSPGAVRLDATYFGESDDCTSPHDALLGRLCKVATSNGRTLYFNYASEVYGWLDVWRLRSISSPSPSSPALISYYYQPSDCGVPEDDCTGSELCCTRDSAGGGENYHYVLSNGPKLRQVDTTSGTVIEKHTWNSIGKVIASESEDVKLNIAYNDAACGSNSTHVTNNYRGNGTEYCLKTDGHGYVTEVSGDCGCSSSQYIWQSGNAARGLQALLRSDGRLTTFARDDSSRMTAMTVNDDNTNAADLPGDFSRQVRFSYVGQTGLLASQVEASAFTFDTTSTTGANYSYQYTPTPYWNGVDQWGTTVGDIDALWSAGPDYRFAWTGIHYYTWRTLTFNPSNPYELQSETIAGPRDSVDDDTIREFYPQDGSLRAGRVHLQKRKAHGTWLTTSFGESITGCILDGYDVWGHPLTMVDEAGVGVCFSYDAQGRLQSVRYAAESLNSGVLFTYRADGRVNTMRMRSGATYRYFYEGGTVAGANAHLLSAIEHWSGAPQTSVLLDREEYGYETADAGHNLLTLQRRVAQYAGRDLLCDEYGQCGTDGLTCDPDQRCRPTTCSTDADCATTESQHAGACRNNVCMQVTSLVEYGYDSKRRRSQVGVHRFSYDAGFPDASRKWIYNDFDLVGALEEEAQGYTNLIYKYDRFDRLTDIKRKPSSTSGDSDLITLVHYEYDKHDNPRSVKYYNLDGTEKSSTQYRYDDFGRLSWVDTPESAPVAYQYDGAGNMIYSKDESGAYGQGKEYYQYDESNRLTAIQYPYRDPIVYTYDGNEANDPNDARSDIKDCSATDAAGYFAWPSNRYVTGRLSKVVDRSGVKYFNYNERGQRVSSVDLRTGDSCARVTSWTYDAAGRLTAMQYPTGRKVRYTYGGLDPDRPSGIDVWQNDAWVPVVQEVGYSDQGRVGHILWGNGMMSFQSTFLDGSPRLRQTFGYGAEVFSRQVVSTDALGNPTQINSIDGVTGSPMYSPVPSSESYAYDPVFHYLTSGTRPEMQAFAEGYGYEQNRLGDRSQKITGATTPYPMTSAYTYVPGTSKVSSIITSQQQPQYREDYEYDDLGAVSKIHKRSVESFDTVGAPVWQSMASAPVQTFGYDEKGELTSVDAISYSYDYRRLRTRTTNSTYGNGTIFHYSDGGELLSETRYQSANPTAMELREYLWLNGEPIAQISSQLFATGAPQDQAPNAGLYYILNGLLGEPRRAYASWRNPLDGADFRADYTPFGERTASDTALVDLRIGLPGQYWDSETQQWYNWHRYYSSGLGRYLMSDPLLSVGRELPPFSYANAVPTRSVDPTGLDVGFARQGNGDDPYGTKRYCEYKKNKIRKSIVPPIGYEPTQEGKDRAWYIAKKVNEIVDHSYEDKVLMQDDFSEVANRDDFVSVVLDTIDNPLSLSKPLKDGGIAYFDRADGTLVILRNNGPSTAFRPDRGEWYFWNRVH